MGTAPTFLALVLVAMASAGAPYLASGKCSSLVLNHAPAPKTVGAVYPVSVSSIQIGGAGAVGSVRNNTVLFTTGLLGGSIMSVGAGGALNYLTSGPQSTVTTFPASAIDADLSNGGGGIYLGGGVRTSQDTKAVYFSAGSSVYRLDESQVVTLLAGAYGKTGYSGDGGDARLAVTSGWLGFALAEELNAFFITDIWNQIVRKVDMGTGIITHFAGVLNGSLPTELRTATPGDGSLALDAVFAYPWHADYFKNALYVLDSGLYNVRRIDLATNRVKFVVGYSNAIPANAISPLMDIASSGVLATSILVEARYITMRPNGAMLLAGDESHTIREVSPTGIIRTLVGEPGVCAFRGDGGPARAAHVCSPWGVSAMEDGSLVIGDRGNNAIRYVDAASGVISTIAGGQSINAAQTLSAAVNNSGTAVAVMSNGDLMVTECGPNAKNFCFLNFARGTLTIFAGPPANISAAGYSGDGGPALGASFNPGGGGGMNFAIDSRNDDILFCDSWNHVIRRISNGIVTRVAGVPGKAGYRPSDEGAPALEAWLSRPSAVLMMPDTRDLLFIDAYNNCIRRIGSISGLITTFAGLCGSNQNPDNGCNFSPDGTPALGAILQTSGSAGSYSASSLSLTANGSVIFVDQLNMVRAIDRNGLLRTLVGVSCAAIAAGQTLQPLANNTPALAVSMPLIQQALVYTDGSVMFSGDSHAIWVVRDGMLVIVAGVPFQASCTADGSLLNRPSLLLQGRNGEIFVNELACASTRVFPLGASTICPPGYYCVSRI